ncbi:hypothetical protein [Streptomyces profundus]|uniref:hypothetical protein n=1 Tax=Streptomyces profundus TaxID=2867410 RepID=UPI001D15E805|nr:hypothetical protein [Streptomyces sp. MA3_2.13]UED87585.1 hypothetical protein K4G22_28080 [Streptomyces sp. MA3_2.13]
MTEQVSIKAAGPDGRRETVRLTHSDQPPYAITLHRAAGGDETYEGSNLFVCLTELRKELERDGLLLCCQGARGDVTPSGLESQMTGGRYVYTFTPGERQVNQEYVDIFAPAAYEDVVTVAEQRAAVLAFHGLPDTGWEPR